MSDNELADRASDGDVEAFEVLYRRHEARIHGLCLRMTADPSRAEELTQQAFVRAWQRLPSFRGRSAFGTWLHRLAVNLILGDFRSRKRRLGRLVSEPPESLPERPSAGEPEAAIDLERAITTLPPKARLVFVLHDVEGFSHVEIAELTGIAEGTSKAHLHRARRLLRKRLSR